MDEKASDLLEIVRKEINLYRDLIEHVRRKTALLVQGRAEEILQSNLVDETYNIRLRTLEGRMTSLCHDLGRSFRIPREEITLMRLADNLEQSLAQEIRIQATLFRNIVKQLKSVNQRNMRLIERSLHYSRGLLALISRQAGWLRPIPHIPPTFPQRT